MNKSILVKLFKSWLCDKKLKVCFWYNIFLGLICKYLFNKRI